MAIAGIDTNSDSTRMFFYHKSTFQAVTFEGKPFLPTAVALDGKKLLVGWDAVNQRAKNNLITNIPAQIGTNHTWKIGKRTYTAEELMTLVLKACIEQEKQWEAVLTVPAHFDDAKRAALKQSAQATGLRVHRLIPGPTAAAIAHFVDLRERQTILVIDMGHDFFEVSLLEVAGNEFQVISVEGGRDHSLSDLDATFASNLKNRAGLHFEEGSKHQNHLIGFAANSRESLASRRSLNLEIPSGDDAPALSLGRFTRQDYGNVAQPHLESMAACILAVVSRTGRNPQQIDRFLFTGAGARHRVFQDFFRDRLGSLAIPKEPETLAVRGAAMVGALMEAQQHKPLLGGVANLSPELSALKFQDVIPHSLGITVKSNKGFLFKKMRYVPILEKDKPYPAREAVLGFAETLWTERLIMKIYRGESEEPDENVALGRMIFPVSRTHLGKDAVIMACIFQLDADGILTFTAVEMPMYNKARRDLEHLKKTALANDLRVPIAEVDKLCERFNFKTMALTIKAR